MSFVHNEIGIWSEDALWNKAKLYMERAYSVPRQDDLFPFWASLALEFVARSALAFVHSVLLAETNDNDGANILFALGVVPKQKSFIPKSIPVVKVFRRCEQIIPEFTQEHEKFCTGLANHRNEELHTGGLPFNGFDNQIWLPRFYEVMQLLVTFQEKTLEELIGLEEAVAAKKLVEAMVDNSANTVNKDVQAHKHVWDNKTTEEKATLTALALKEAVPWKGHVVDCPSCNSKALLIGEQISQMPPVLEDDQIVIRQNMLPVEFKCSACALRIKGAHQLHALGMGSLFTNTVKYDPIEFYADANYYDYIAEPAYDDDDFFND